MHFTASRNVGFFAPPLALPLHVCVSYDPGQKDLNLLHFWPVSFA